MRKLTGGHEAASIVVVGLLLLTAASGAVGAVSENQQSDLGDEFDAPAFIVGLDEDGSATLTVTFTFDLTDENRRAAFVEIRDDERTRESFRTSFRDRFQSVARDTANATGREMSVTNATLEFRTADDTGVVEATVDWSGLASVDGDRLRITEPFASGFSTDRAVHVVAPEGYVVDSVTPAPEETTDRSVSYDEGADLAGFELIAQASPEPTTDDTSDSGDETTAGETVEDGAAEDGTEATTMSDETAAAEGPGFGSIATLAALLALAVLLARR